MDKIIDDIKMICNKDTNPFKTTTYFTLSIEEHYKGLHEIESVLSHIINIFGFETNIDKDIRQTGSVFSIIPIKCSYTSIELIKQKYGDIIKKIEYLN